MVRWRWREKPLPNDARQATMADMNEHDQPAQEPTSGEPSAGENSFAEPQPLTGYRFNPDPDPLGWDPRSEIWKVARLPYLAWCSTVQRLSAGETFHVPPRFGMSAILGITTALALLFGLFRLVDTHPLVYVFSALLVGIICVVQMRWGHIARPASILAGAIWLPLFILALTLTISLTEDRWPPLGAIFCATVFAVPFGGLLGYLAGTCAGGFFLLMDLFEKYWEQRRRSSRLDDSREPR